VLDALVLDGWRTGDNKWVQTMAGIAIAPLMGMAAGALLMVIVAWTFRRGRPRVLDYYFRRLQLFSSAVFSFAHGTNDAQKTMGIIASVLFASGYLETFSIPVWVVLSAHAAIALGTLLGGWRVIRTMGHRITRLKPVGGFCAETGGAFTVLFAAAQGIPASTTHTIAGAIVGVGTAQRLKAVRWGKASEILWAWVITIPTTLAVGGLSYLLVRTIFPEAQ
jgi:PiT family inorganic phosphate transporter